MSMPPEDFRLPIERVTAPEFVRRVERDAPGSDSRNKNKNPRQDDKHPPNDSEADIPQDVVDVSEQYHPIASSPATPAKSASIASGQTPGSEVSPSGGASSHPPDRHLDIQV